MLYVNFVECCHGNSADTGVSILPGCTSYFALKWLKLYQNDPHNVILYMSKNNDIEDSVIAKPDKTDEWEHFKDIC